jgi:uncharacterized protein (TIGR02145 family)
MKHIFTISLSFLALSLSAYGQNNYSMGFDGVDDYVEITNANLFSNDNQFSLNVWVKISSHAFNNTEAIMSKWSDNGASNNRPFHLQFSVGSNSIDFHVNGASSTVNMNISDIILNEWNMLTCIYDDVNGVIQFYHNGILKNQNSIGSGGNLQEYNNKMIIGSHTETTYEFFTGNIDNPSIWNIALTQEQIQNYMNCPPTGNEEGLLGYWNFEEGSGTTVFDQTSNGNDGTINGATWSTDVPEQNCQSGCTDFVACNYNPDATEDDGSCDYTCCPGPGCCSEGLYWDWDLQECFITNPSDINLDGCVQLDDLLDLLSAYGDCGAPSFICGDPVDHQGYSYSTVLIGEQCWFKENCRYLPDVTDSSVESFTEPLYYVYDYEGDNVLEAKQTSNYEDFGVLYNFVAATSDNICPSEWHPPTELEFLELIDFAGGPEIAGDALKAEEGWADSYIEMQGSNGSNSSGFTAVPNGYFSNATGFNRLYTYGWMWTSTSIGELNGRYLQLFTHTETAGTTSASNFYGFSARCIKD